MTTWKKEPPTEEDWYWILEPACDTEPFVRHLSVDDIAWEDWDPDAEFGPRIPSPERLEALEECAKAVRTIDDLHNLGDAVYVVREREGEGWDGPKVTAYSKAVAALGSALARLDESEDRCSKCGDSNAWHDGERGVDGLCVNCFESEGE